MKKITKKQIAKVENFAARELLKVANTLIIETEYGWALFGKYHIDRMDNGCFMLRHDNDAFIKKQFNKVRNAVSWAVLWDKNKITTANRVHELDTMIGSMEFESQLHKKLKSSGDIEFFSIQETKLSESIAKQKQFTQEMDKYIKQAKISQLRGYENELKRTSREQ